MPDWSRSTTLGDLGERRIISEVLRERYGHIAGFGDDCAWLGNVPEPGFLVATTDPCPEPMAAILGFHDPYYRGWLLGTINLSDIAAAGARPLGLVTSMVLPRDYRVVDLQRVLDGVDDACATAATRVVGGNLKEGPKVDLSATAIGSVDGRPLRRTGARPGDVVAVIGDLGVFWAGALSVFRKLLSPDPGHALLRNVLLPKAKVASGIALHNAGVVSGLMDSSDGLGSTFEDLARASDVRFDLSLTDDALPGDVREVADRLGVEPWRLALGWGDWQLVATISGDAVEHARSVVAATGDEMHVIGEVAPGQGVWLRYGRLTGRLNAPLSERFAKDSWFTAGIESYITTIMSAPLVR